MSISTTGEPTVKKKQVRFARVGEDDDNDDQDEDTLFDKRKDTRSGLKSMMKRVRRVDDTGLDRVAVAGHGNSGAGSGSGGFHRWMVTIALCASFLGLGMCISVVGPTFGDLATNVRQNISNISYIFVGRSAGYIGGSVMAGFLFEIMNPHLMLGFTMLLTAFGMIGVPICKKAALLTMLMSTVGISIGFLDTGGNVLILKTWGEHSGPHLQALHFSFAVGAFISPIIAKLVFGSDEHADDGAGVGDVTTQRLVAPTVHSTMSLQSSTTSSTAQIDRVIFHINQTKTLKSMWAYVVIGAFILLVSLVFFILYSRSNPSRDMARTSQGKVLMAKYHNTLVLLLFFFFFWYVGAEVAYGSFIFTYAIHYAKMAEPQAAGLNSLFWGTFAITRGLAIFMAACVKPGTLILLSLVGSTLSSLLMVLFNTDRTVLWTCTGLYGASMATTFPSGISWMEQYTTVTGRSAAVFVVGAALGEMVLPAVVGVLLGKMQHLPVLMYLSLGTATITSILFPVMYKLATSPGTAGWRPRDKGPSGTDDGEHYQALLDTGANEEEEEDEDEADQWNDADFEVIEMDDASLLSSPEKSVLPPPSCAAETAEDAPGNLSTPDDTTALGGPEHPSVSTAAFLGDSPKLKPLVSLNREKRD